MHQGVDIGAGYGSTVKAVAGGTVIFTGWQGGYGNTVEISHGSGLVTQYAHLSSISVSNGKKVERGEKIGLVGATGRADGPHLHFEVRIGGTPRNPANYLP
jgi:murein DD-endopeptidase MepM/ murein hydrolase activator NlpD